MQLLRVNGGAFHLLPASLQLDSHQYDVADCLHASGCSQQPGRFLLQGLVWLGAVNETSACCEQVRSGELVKALLYLPESQLQTTTQMIRAGENPCPSRRAVRQLAESLEVHQRGRGWKVNPPWLDWCRREACSAGLRHGRLVEQVVHPNGHGAQDFRVRILAKRDRGCDAIGRQKHWAAMGCVS